MDIVDDCRLTKTRIFSFDSVRFCVWGDGSQLLWVIQYSLPSMHRCTDVLCVCLVNLRVHVCNLSYICSLFMPA